MKLVALALVSLAWTSIARAADPPAAIVFGDLRWRVPYLSACALSPDGTRLATGGVQGDVLIWDVKTGALVKKLFQKARFEHMPSRPTSMAFDATGRLVTGDDEDAIRVWDLERGELAGEPIQRGGAGTHVDALHVLPGGAHAVADLYGFRVFTLATGVERNEIAGAVGPAGAVASGGKSLFADDEKGVLGEWDLASGRRLATFADLAREPSAALAASPDGRWIARAVRDGHELPAVVIDAKTRKVVAAIPTRRSARGTYGVAQTALAFTRENQLLIGDREGQIALVEPATGQTVRAVQPSRRAIYTLAVAGAVLASAGRYDLNDPSEVRPRVWTLPELTEVAPPAGHAGMVRDAVLTADEKTLVTSGDDDGALVWNVADGKLVKALTRPDGIVHWLALSPDGARLVASSRWGTAIYRTADWSLEREVPGRGGPVAFAGADPERVYVAPWSAADNVNALDLASGAERTLFRAPARSGLGAIAPSRGGKLVGLAGHGGDRFTWLVDGATGAVRRRFEGSRELAGGKLSPPPRIALHPTLPLVYAGYGTGVLHDHDAGRDVRRLGEVANPTTAVRFSAGGEWLGLGHRDGWIAVVTGDTATEAFEAGGKGDLPWVSALALPRSAPWVISGHADGTVRRVPLEKAEAP